MKNRYRLIPQNENQSLNFEESFIGTKRAAVDRARYIAYNLQHLFPTATITCGIQTPSEGLRGIIGLVVLPDGNIINDKGYSVKV